MKTQQQSQEQESSSPLIDFAFGIGVFVIGVAFGCAIYCQYCLTGSFF